ncbi:hypothetical protein MNV49_002237 [Pseudohyphozyma bogoriensis]|nr:hypothetical protein MNV49_002237 [Pseudohyphozyma bogoriensis]
MTKKAISENPGPNTVTAPNDGLDMDNLHSKMKLYGVIQAFREGRYPSNEQCVRTLEYLRSDEGAPIEVSKLSKDGKMLVQDFRNVILTLERIVKDKNADELAQNFLYHTREIDYSKAKVTGVNAPDQGERKADADQAVEHLRTLGKLIFTNSEARKLLKDVGILGRDVAADAAAKVSDVARPSDEALDGVDEPAPSNQWVGPDGEVRSHNDPAPDTGLAAKRDEAKAKKEEAKAQKEEAKQQAKDEAAGTADRVAGAADQGQQGALSDEDRARGAAGAGSDQAQAEANTKKDQLQAQKNKLINKIPDEHKDRAKEQLQRTKDYAKEKFPQERRDRFIYRLKKVVVEQQRHRDYQEAIEYFLDRAEKYHGHAQNISKDGAGQALEVRNDEAYQAAETELRTLLERFANGQSSQPIFDSVNQLYTDAKNDEELRAWFRKLDGYVRRVLQESGYIMKEEANRDGRRLRDEGKAFWDPKDGKYAGHKDAFFDSVSSFFKAFAEDELNTQLGLDVKKLTKDLLMDSEGNLKFKPHLWDDIRTVILPGLATHIGLIPIPRIEYTDNAVDVVIENLALQSQNILPNIFEFEAKNYFKISPYQEIKDQSKHSFMLSFSQAQADIKDLQFYIKKKQGFPKITDSGEADVFLGGKGISGKVQLESTGRKNHAFNVVSVKVKIDKLSFTVRDSKYSFLISTLKPLLTGLVKKGVTKAIEQAIRDGLVQLDAQLSDISERMEDAKKEDDSIGTFENLKSSYSAKKAEAQEAKAKVEEKTPSGQFQITAKRDSKLVDWSSPVSLVEKEGEKSDLAKAGGQDGWKSPAFDIVGNSPSVSAH